MADTVHKGSVVTEVVVGSTYAYRARSVDDVVPVTVLRQGSKSPARVLIRFDDPSMEGREEWVPPSRLKVEWADADAFRADEARWAAVEVFSPGLQSAELNAAEHVLELLLPQETAYIGYRDGYMTVTDVDAVAQWAGVEPAFVCSHPDGFELTDGGPLIVPWPIAVELVKRAVALNPEPVVRSVATEEAKARHEAIHGHHFRHGRNEFGYIEPERCAQWDEESEFGAPFRRILREWAGGAADRWDEVVELRREIKRVGDIAEEAIVTLRRVGAARDADRLAQSLGVPVEMLRLEPDN